MLQESILSNNSIPESYFEAIVDEYTDHYAVPYGYMTPKSFYFIGERITLDSYALDRLVYPFLPPNKTLPNGLEFATACLESNRAKELLESEYEDQYVDISDDIKNWDEDEKDTVLWKWTSTFKNLLQPVSLSNSDVKIHYPEFMDKKQWQDEKLTTVLGSWAQLRHDSILYGRQSYSGFLTCSTPDGYVEPYPEFFARLRNTVDLYRAVLEECNIFDIFDLYEINIGYRSFDEFECILENLEEIALYELNGTALTEEQQEFITSTYSYSKVGCVYEDTGWIIRFLQTLQREFRMNKVSPYVSLIADIHTDPNTGKVMEIGTGLLEHLICIVPGFNKSKILAVGPVFSYYEFYIAMDKRMTDEEWRSILYNFDSVDWFRGPWAQTYMVSTQKTTSSLGYTPTLYPPDWYTPDFSDAISPYGELNYNLLSESSPIWVYFAFNIPVLCLPIIYALFIKHRKKKK
jgi:hypothetical protein